MQWPSCELEHPPSALLPVSILKRRRWDQASTSTAGRPTVDMIDPNQRKRATEVQCGDHHATRVAAPVWAGAPPLRGCSGGHGDGRSLGPSSLVGLGKESGS